MSLLASKLMRIALHLPPPRCCQGLGQLAGELKLMSTKYKEKDSDQQENIKIVLWVSLK